MGIINTIISSGDDLNKPKNKSYWGYEPEIKLIQTNKIRFKKTITPSEKRTLKYELSGEESIRDLIILDNKKKSLGRFTTEQVKDMFDDMGFNVDVLLSAKRESDFSAVMNIGGYAIPMWVKAVRIISRFFPSREKMLLTKLAPGNDRLHVRVFENNDGTWLLIAHTDHNWMSLNLVTVLRSHVGSGAGDYITGTRMLYELFKKFINHLKTNKVFPSEDIIKVTNWAYYQSLADKLKLSLNVEDK